MIDLLTNVIGIFMIGLGFQINSRAYRDRGEGLSPGGFLVVLTLVVILIVSGAALIEWRS